MPIIVLNLPKLACHVSVNPLLHSEHATYRDDRYPRTLSGQWSGGWSRAGYTLGTLWVASYLATLLGHPIGKWLRNFNGVNLRNKLSNHDCRRAQNIQDFCQLPQPYCARPPHQPKNSSPTSITTSAAQRLAKSSATLTR